MVFEREPSVCTLLAWLSHQMPWHRVQSCHHHNRSRCPPHQTSPRSCPQLPELPATYPGQNDCEGSFSGNEAAPGQAELRSIASGHHHLFDKDYFASLPPPEAQIGELAAAVIFSDDLKRALNVHVTVDDALQFLQTRLL